MPSLVRPSARFLLTLIPMKTTSLSKTLKDLKSLPPRMPDKEKLDAEIKALQLKLVKIQQGFFHMKERAVIIFEGFDAAGKGGAIRTLTENLDPRGVRVIPIAAPTPEEQGKHYLYRFWKELPSPGNITIFDRSWYGRLLVEKVDRLSDQDRLLAANEEINQFEKLLQNDGIKVIKIFLAITKSEQLERFEDRLNDPYKQWKITIADIEARRKWNRYVEAVDDILKKNNPKSCPWHVIPANSKRFARRESLKVVTKELGHCERWIEKAAHGYKKTKLTKLLRMI